MSILSDLLNRKITFSQAATQIESWGVSIVRNLANDPTVIATTGAVVSDLKQAASDALSIADNFAGPILASEAAMIEASADAVFKAYFGPFSPIASKAMHDSVDRLAMGLKALIDAKTAEYKASMQPVAAPTIQPHPANQ